MIPKSLLSILMVVAATFSVAATDHLFIEDFTIQPGQTAQVEVLLESEAQYTAFQTDLYMPEGLTIDVQSLALTSRKASDHMLAHCVLINGAVRVMSYSMHVQPYSGTSGAILTFNVTASETFAGPADVVLKNIRLTNVAGTDMALDNTSCTVSSGKLGDVNGDSNLTITDVTSLINYLLNGDVSSIRVDLADVNNDGNVTITDVTSLINGLLNGPAN